jgi:hypothetical protein
MNAYGMGVDFWPFERLVIGLAGCVVLLAIVLAVSWVRGR